MSYGRITYAVGTLFSDAGLRSTTAPVNPTSQIEGSLPALRGTCRGMTHGDAEVRHEFRRRLSEAQLFCYSAPSHGTASKVLYESVKSLPGYMAFHMPFSGDAEEALAGRRAPNASCSGNPHPVKRRGGETEQCNNRLAVQERSLPPQVPPQAHRDPTPWGRGKRVDIRLGRREGGTPCAHTAPARCWSRLWLSPLRM